MFVDFNKVFGKTPQAELKIPQPLIDQLSEKLPDGLVYVVDSNNNLTISHDEKKNLEYTISGIALDPTDQQKKILGNKCSFKDIMSLSYNSQQPVPLKFKNGKYIVINGVDVSVEELSYNPFKEHELIIDSTCIYPPKFPPAFTMQIGSNDTKIDLLINRVPYNSLGTMAFESDNSKCLSIVYYFDPEKRYFSMTMNIAIDKAKTVQEIVDSIEIYNAFVEGKGYIFDSLINTRLETKNSCRYDNEVLKFWKKVKNLEDKLGLSFEPSRNKLEFEDICNIEEIYQNIINKIPIRHNKKITTITSEWEFSKDDIAKDILGKPIYFEFNDKTTIDLFGQNIEFSCIVGVFNAVLEKYEKNEKTGECILFLENKSNENQMYTSILRFLNEGDLLKYKKEIKDRIIQFRDAKRKYEYLIREQ